MTDIITTAIISAVSVIILFVLARLMGKKQISQLTFFDYVVGISIGSIAADFAVDPTIYYVRGITGLIVFAIFPIIVSFLSLKSYTARKLFDGSPTILIQNGKIIEQNMKKAKMNCNDLLEECRLNNVFNISEIEFAILETSGRLSVELKSSFQPLTPGDMHLPTNYKGLCTNLILDGTILDEHLAFIKKDRVWLTSELIKQNFSKADDLLLAYIDTEGGFHCHPKNHHPIEPPLL